MDQKALIEKIVGSGLFDIKSEEPYFTWGGCDHCADGKGATVYDCVGYETLEETHSKDNLHSFKLCVHCLQELYYGKE